MNRAPAAIFLPIEKGDSHRAAQKDFYRADEKLRRALDGSTVVKATISAMLRAMRIKCVESKSYTGLAAG